MNHWWVNQNQTYLHEVGGGYLWSPKVNTNGRRNRFYESMTEAEPGDVIFSFCDTLIKAVGVVSGKCDSAPKPTEFGSAGSYWSDEGWYLPVRFTELNQPIKPKAHMDTLAQFLPSKYSPIQASGNGNQGVYLAPLPSSFAGELIRLLAGQVESIVSASPVELDPDGDEAEQRIKSDTTIPVTVRVQLINARVGQGLFRSRVEMIESDCRVTGVSDRRFLRASHVKPWSKSDSHEKLDGSNGLLLAPHIDHLFDKGFISFANDGRLIISQALPTSVQGSWNLHAAISPRPMSQMQIAYMAYHRTNVFLS